MHVFSSDQCMQCKPLAKKTLSKMTLNDIINKLRCLNETIKCLVLLVSEHQPVLIWMSVGTFFVES